MSDDMSRREDPSETETQVLSGRRDELLLSNHRVFFTSKRIEAVILFNSRAI